MVIVTWIIFLTLFLIFYDGTIRSFQWITFPIIFTIVFYVQRKKRLAKYYELKKQYND